MAKEAHGGCSISCSIDVEHVGCDVEYDVGCDVECDVECDVG